jgi:hemerythrin-like domain-containing protein
MRFLSYVPVMSRIIQSAAVMAHSARIIAGEGLAMATTIETLREQHQTVLARLNEVEAAAPGQRAAMEAFLAFLRSELHEHLGLEEEALFPVLSHHPHLATGPVAVMEAEHRECDALVAELAIGLRSGSAEPLAAVAERIIALLRAHIDKEDHVLFPLAAHMLSAAEHDEVDARAAARTRRAEPAAQAAPGRRRAARRM